MRLTVSQLKQIIKEELDDILQEKYVDRSCKKKDDTSGHCAVISHKTNKQKACYDDCDTARGAMHLEEDSEEPEK